MTTQAPPIKLLDPAVLIAASTSSLLSRLVCHPRRCPLPTSRSIILINIYSGHASPAHPDAPGCDPSVARGAHAQARGAWAVRGAACRCCHRHSGAEHIPICIRRCVFSLIIISAKILTVHRGEGAIERTLSCSRRFAGPREATPHLSRSGHDR